MLVEGVIVGGIKAALVSKEVITVASMCTFTGVGALLSRIGKTEDATIEQILISRIAFIVALLSLLGVTGYSMLNTLQIVEAIFFSF